MSMKIVTYHQVRMINVISGDDGSRRTISYRRVHPPTDIRDHGGNGLVGKCLRYIKRNAFGNGKSVFGDV